MATITSIAITCTPAKSEILTVVNTETEYVRVNERKRLPEQVRVNERKRLPNGEHVICESISEVNRRTFPAYVHQPVNAARLLAEQTRRELPGVPVTLYGA
jgi:hypothetical protein